MLIRRNTKAFKAIHEIVESCQRRADRDKLIRLYITRAGQRVHDRISIEGMGDQAALFYEMTYQTLLNNLTSPNHQLHLSDEVPGLYFFHSHAISSWDQTPFEFDEAINEIFAAVPDRPAVRKPEKVKKAAPSFAVPRLAAAAERKKNGEKKKKKELPHVAKETREVQPDFRLKQAIAFSHLDQMVYRNAGVSKLDVLNYYHEIAPYILPFLKNRPLWVRREADHRGAAVELSVDGLLQGDRQHLPSWINVAKEGEGQGSREFLLCNDREHLLYYVELGCLEFCIAHATLRNPDTPDYLVIELDSPDSDPEKVVPIAHGALEVCDGLRLPVFVKSDGVTGLHFHIPLDKKSTFAAARDVAQFLCRLFGLKLGDSISLKGYAHGKVSVDYTTNEAGKAVVAPYSLLAGQGATVAVPLHRDEFRQSFGPDQYNVRTVQKKLAQAGDPFERLFARKINGDELLDDLRKNYSFLF